MMWKKSEPEELISQPSPAAQVTSLSMPKNSAPLTQESALIGPTISIKGNLTGEEDLLIEGRLEGKIELRHNSITIGKNGFIKADIYAKVITVEGTVEGNIFGEAQLIVRHCGTMRGNIVSPRVALEDGCNFKGSIDMRPIDTSAIQQEKENGIGNRNE
jgi:cytoskeletal protein CcmA (bactofilin family)